MRAEEYCWETVANESPPGGGQKSRLFENLDFSKISISGRLPAFEAVFGTPDAHPTPAQPVNINLK